MVGVTTGVPRRCLGRCGKLVMPPASRCQDCVALVARPFKRHGWTTIRDAWKREHPECVVCGRTDGVEVDHIIPLADGGRIDGPLQTLCHEHHVAAGVARRRRK